MSKKKRSPLALLFLFLILGVGCVFLVMMVSQNKAPKPDPAVMSSLKSKAKAFPVSKQWDAYVRGPGALKSKPIEALVAMLMDKKSNKRRWFPDLAKAQKALAALAKHKATYLSLMKDKGCPPGFLDVVPKDKSKQISLLSVIRGTKLVVLDSVALAQAGKLDQAVSQLQLTMSGTTHLNHHCQSSLLTAMIFVVLADIISSYASYVLLHPQLKATAKDALLTGLQGLLAGNPMPEALRAELKFQHRMVDTLTSGKLKEDAPVRVGVMWWPFWDAKLTKKWITQLSAAEIHRAMQPYGKALWRVYPVQKFFDKAHRTPKWRLWFQYNAVGMILMSLAQPNTKKFTAKYHQHRCLIHATHAALLAAWRKQKLAMPTKQALQKVTHPFTGKSFASPLPAKVCAIVNPSTKKALLAGRPVKLPSAPPAAPADGDATPKKTAPTSPKKSAPAAPKKSAPTPR